MSFRVDGTLGVRFALRPKNALAASFAVAVAAIGWLAAPAPLTAQSTPYAVQTFATEDSLAAVSMAQEVSSALEGVESVRIVRDGPWFKLHVGRYASRSDASGLLRRVQAAGYPDAWVTDAPATLIATVRAESSATRSTETVVSETVTTRETTTYTIRSGDVELEPVETTRAVETVAAADPVETEPPVAEPMEAAPPADESTRPAPAETEVETADANASAENGGGAWREGWVPAPVRAQEAEGSRVTAGLTEAQTENGARDATEAADAASTVPLTEAQGGDVAANSSATTDAPTPNATPAAPRAIRSEAAIRRDGALSVDGRLDDPAWQTAPVITDFVQGEPFEGAEPSEPTEVRVLFDDDALYVGARMYESDPNAIRARLTRRDERGSYDHFTVSLDPNRDGLTGYQFQVSAAGAEGDRYLFGDTQQDENWDAIWDSAVQIDDQGWTAEMRIPLSQIRYEARAEPQAWGINFERRRLETNETDYYSLESRTQRGKVSQFGEIAGLQLPSASRRFEVRPFVVSQVHTAPSEADNPLFDGSEFDPRGGLDLSMGIGSAFSLDATFNPDFGQVEVDPEVINLTAFETFFPEKRPFFVQDAQIFTFAGSRGGRFGGGKALFFSRRIGRAPRGFGPFTADFQDRPTQTTILGAAKLTGRTTSGLSVGALAAVTGRETGQAYFAADDSLGTFIAEPQAEHGVIRLQQDFRGGASKIGVIGTGLKRELPGDGSFDFLASTAYSFGVDFEHQWGGQRGRDFRLWGFYSGSLVQGSTDAITRLQRNSNHYFQRPDADYLAVDSTATSMFGSDWRLQLEKQGRNWSWSTWLGQQSPGFEINDFGFLTSGERLDVGARLSYNQFQPGKLFRNYNISVFSFHNFRHSLLDDVTSWDNIARSYDAGSIWVSGRFTFLNNWGFNINGSYSPRGQSDTQTRGGPLMTDPEDWNIRIDANSDRTRSLHFSPNFSYRVSGLDRGQEVRTGLNISYRPVPNWRLSLEPSFSKSRDAAQYVTRSGALEFLPTFGDRYLFGNLERTSVSMDTRLNVSFTPDMSLQLYAQPLLSSGDYLGYRQLAASESFDFIDYTEGTPIEVDGVVTGCLGGTTCVLNDVRHFDFDGDGGSDHATSDRDFNIRSLRGNAVFRWEYRPGSELFLVWQHSRRDRFNDGNFDFNRDFSGLFSAPAENVFIIKMSHYLSF